MDEAAEGGPVEVGDVEEEAGGFFVGGGQGDGKVVGGEGVVDDVLDGGHGRGKSEMGSTKYETNPKWKWGKVRKG